MVRRVQRYRLSFGRSGAPCLILTILVRFRAYVIWFGIATPLWHCLDQSLHRTTYAFFGLSKYFHMGSHPGVDSIAGLIHFRYVVAESVFNVRYIAIWRIQYIYIFYTCISV